METWPENFPPDCPPTDAEPASGQYYRLVANDPPKESDFYSHLDWQERGRFRGREWPDRRIAAGVSVFKVRAEAEKLKAAVPAMRNKKIALGDVTGSGRMKNTPSHTGPSHHTWWRPVGDEAWKGFEVTQ